jgi:hypothetical protein
MAESQILRGFGAYPMFSPIHSITTDEVLYFIASTTSRFKTLPNLPFSREGAEEKCQIKSPGRFNSGLRQ